MKQNKKSGFGLVVRVLLLSAWMLYDSVKIILLRLLHGMDRARHASAVDGDFELVVMSQVPWDYLWQRNHHTMARISENRKVLYCCPIPTITAAKEGKDLVSFSPRKYKDNLMYLRPLVLWGDSRLSAVRILNRLIMRNLLKWYAAKNGMGNRRRILWFYVPTFESIAGHMGEDLVMYDIQDEYSSFSWFPPDTAEKEKGLLHKCDLVFTGTLQLWKRKNQYNKNMHFIQCGVESGHFGRSLEKDTVIPADVANLEKPILGYFGLVDARIDMELLESVASRRPEWTIILIGPCHIEKRSPNILTIGRRDYEELPGYLRAFDICLIPFVMNDNTRNLNPTKLLEYFASGKPVISTPIPDVIDLYQDLVEIVATPDEFIHAAERALSSDEEKKALEREKEAMENSWDGMVGKMLSHMERTLEEKGKQE
jgi:glycosyltransferase involved in cell wall biosynthesis